MYYIDARNVNDAWHVGMNTLLRNPARQETRNGPALVLREPMVTVYQKPVERVLLDPVRDQNPFFTLFEGIWMWSGRDDATYLDQFVSDFSARFAEKAGVQHGAYGKRWRDWFPDVSTPDGNLDQIDHAIKLLKANPQDRQVLLQMWDPSMDLGAKVKDKPCNSLVYLRTDFGVLDITVCCRSNDAVYGAWGANAVHFSMLQEMLAAQLGVPVGRYTQVSNNIHAYENTLGRWNPQSAKENAANPYPGTVPMVTVPEAWDEEVKRFLEDPEGTHPYANGWLTTTAQPMWMANAFRREKKWQHAQVRASQVQAPDWRAAATEWLQRRVAKQQVA